MRWAGGFLRAAAADVGVHLELHSIVSEHVRIGLASLQAKAFDALVLINHAPFLGSGANEAQPLVEIVRREAIRAIVGFELAQRVSNTVALHPGDPESWPVFLAELLKAEPCRLTPETLSMGKNASARSFDSLQSPLIDTYLLPLFKASKVKVPIVLAWPREAFFDGDVPGQPLPLAIEAAGRARILAYGPYLPLPVGRWHAKIFLGFSPDIGKMPFIFEVDCDGVITRGFFEVDRGGIFALELDFKVADSLAPIEVRLISQDSALEGQLSLIEIELRPSV